MSACHPGARGVRLSDPYYTQVAIEMLALGLSVGDFSEVAGSSVLLGLRLAERSRTSDFGEIADD